MITIQAAMLVLLGVLIATLLVLLILPSYGRRAARLATDAIRRAMPLSESEIRADKDRLRAEHAITIHKLEKKIDEMSFSAARQLVEINRRDAAISALEGELAGTKTQIEEAENARRVLELTITDRLPRVEQRFADAKKLLIQRDREIATLTETAAKQTQAIEEAKAINAQLRDELHRANATLAARAAKSREAMTPDTRFEEEVALRTELEALRAKARDQASLIGRLQGRSAKGGTPADGAAAAETGADINAARLANDLAEAEIALRQARLPAADGGNNATAAREAELRALRAQKQDGDAEIARLKAALKAYEGDDTADATAMKESKLALKAKLTSIQAQTEQQQATIHSLRADLAAANERLARQANHFMEELRRLGAGTHPVSGPPRREGATAPPAERRRSLAERIAAPRPQAPQPPKETAPVNGAAAAAETAPAAAAASAAPERKEQAAGRVEGFLRALDAAPPDPNIDPAAAVSAGNGAVPLSPPAAPPAAAEAQRGGGLKVSAIVAADTEANRESAAGASPASVAARMAEPMMAAASSAPTAVSGAEATAEQSKPKAPRRPGLLERLTGVDKSASSAE